MKNLTFILVAVSAFIISSCGHEETPKKDLPSSYEINMKGDTFNVIHEGLKQGMWIEKHDGKIDTVYYRNDTLVNK
jgi:hypothetical protein